MEPVIRLQDVTKRYGAQLALDGVSLEVPPGVVFALLGENGAGKTTAIRILLGLTEPDEGQRHRAGARQHSAGTSRARPRGLCARAAHALRMDDRQRDRLVHRRLLRQRLFGALSAAGRRLSIAAASARSRACRRACGPRSRWRWRWRTSPSC